MLENFKIMIVNDDMQLRSQVSRFLSEQHFQFRCVDNTEQMDRLLSRERFHLVILNLPKEHGLSICTRLRQANSQLAILMLAEKDEEIDKIVALEIGADDFLLKPLNFRELSAIIRAMLRRLDLDIPGAPTNKEKIITFGQFTLNLGTREMFKDKQLLTLTSGEFSVLKALVSNARTPLSRDKLMNMARGREYLAMERSIDVQVSRLRRMIEEDSTKPRYIQTVWGLGYVFVPDGKLND